ncbi:MAG: inositol 2-dehydrogenase [Candidatus Bipolaricaulia bacterium]
MAEERIDIGLIGLGRMGSIYVRHLATHIPEARLAAVVDVRAGIAETIAAQYGVDRWYSDHRELLEAEASSLNALVVATSTDTHVEIIEDAAQAGIDIFCEKPVALTLEETDRALEAAHRAGVKLQVGFMRRFDSAYHQAKQKIEAGVIGTPISFKAIGRDPMCPRVDYADPQVSGGLLIDMGIHDFDLARWLMESEVTRVHAEGNLLVCDEIAQVGDIDNAVINLRFASGAIGNVEVSRNAVYGYDIRTEVLGDEGALMIGGLQQTPLLVLNQGGVTHDAVPYIIERFGDAYLEELKHFVACVRDDRTPSVIGEDSRAALEIGLAAIRSFEERRVVELPIVRGDSQ